MQLWKWTLSAAWFTICVAPCLLSLVHREFSNAVLGRHADQQTPGFLQKEATKGTKLTRQQRAKQLRSGVKAITS